MSNQVVVHKGRTNVIAVNMGMDVAGDTLTSEIRSSPSADAPLIATWDLTFVTDGSDGEILLTLSHTVTAEIEADSGYTDIKRVTGGVPVPVFDKPLEVIFRGSVTA